MEDSGSTYKACHLASTRMGCGLWCCSFRYLHYISLFVLRSYQEILMDLIVSIHLLLEFLQLSFLFRSCLELPCTYNLPAFYHEGDINLYLTFSCLHSNFLFLIDSHVYIYELSSLLLPSIIKECLVSHLWEIRIHRICSQGFKVTRKILISMISSVSCMHLVMRSSAYTARFLQKFCDRELPLDCGGCSQINCLHDDVWSMSNWLYSGTYLYANFHFFFLAAQYAASSLKSITCFL